MRRVQISAEAMSAMNIPDEVCWEWHGAVNDRGYGQCRRNGVTRYVHRISYEQYVGPIPQGLFVLHRCDNRRCWRPSHLFLGTAADNTADMMAKGRMRLNQPSGDRSGSKKHPERVPRGERHGAAKLTDAQVLEIRALQIGRKGIRCDVIAKKYGVTPSTIYKLAKNRGRVVPWESKQKRSAS